MTPSEFYALMQSRADKIAEKQGRGRGRPLKYNESTCQISFRLPSPWQTVWVKTGTAKPDRL
jgi:hypothetical protein